MKMIFRLQVSAFAMSNGTRPSKRHVILLSNDLTTVPDNFLDKIDHGNGCARAFLVVALSR